MDSKSVDPTYQNIQDFAETIRVTFDEAQVSYEDCLEMFFKLHTPSSSAFMGTQYRSAIFYHTPEQEALARAKCATKGRLGECVGVEPASDFYKAEEYHQNYIDKAMRS